MKLWALALLLPILVHGVAGDGFVRTGGARFLLNGSPYYANGFNAYWLMYVASDPSQRSKVSAVFREASSHGLTVARTWAFSDGGYRPLQYAPGNYNEQMFQGLDFVVTEARRFGIKLILSLVNNYENFGGKKQYVNWARSKGQYLNSDDDFFRNPVVKGFYKNHVRTVLYRYNRFSRIHYKDDPTIMAWELMNEPRCTSDPSGRTIQVSSSFPLHGSELSGKGSVKLNCFHYPRIYNALSIRNGVENSIGEGQSSVENLSHVGWRGERNIPYKGVETSS